MARYIILCLEPPPIFLQCKKKGEGSVKHLFKKKLPTRHPPRENKNFKKAIKNKLTSEINYK